MPKDETNVQRGALELRCGVPARDFGGELVGGERDARAGGVDRDAGGGGGAGLEGKGAWVWRPYSTWRP